MKHSEFFEQLEAEGLGDVECVYMGSIGLYFYRGSTLYCIEAATAGKYTKGNLRAIVEYFKAEK